MDVRSLRVWRSADPSDPFGPTHAWKGGSLPSGVAPMDSEQTLNFARALAQLHREGRRLQQRIVQRGGVRTILIADDDRALRALLIATLASDSYQLIEAGTGTEALIAVGQHHPMLIILDRQMPGV